MAEPDTDRERAWFEVAFDHFYADLYAHRDDGEAADLLTSLGTRLPEQGPVLDLACGAGRLLRGLAERGVPAVGLDLSRDLLLLARASGAHLVRADMRALPLARGSFAAVFSLFTSFGYFPDPEEDRAFLRSAAALLEPGGLFVLDFFNSSRVVTDLVPRSVQRIRDRDVESLRRYDPKTQVVEKRVRVWRGGDLEREFSERVRAYTPVQLGTLIQAAGIEIRERRGGYRGQPFDGESSPRLILVGERREE